MRLQKYLNEEKYWLDDMDEVVDILKKNCKQYINDVKNHYNGNFLLSGRKGEVFFDKRRVRKDRKPKDTPLEIHEAMDDWFKDEFGIRFRSNSFFAGFIRKIVAWYGETYMVFPIGKYLAISSPNIKDIYMTIEDYMGKTTEVLDLKDDWNILDDASKETAIDGIEHILDKADYKDVRKGYNEKNEVMVHCDEYYVLFYDSILREIGINNLLKKLTT